MQMCLYFLAISTSFAPVFQSSSRTVNSSSCSSPPTAPRLRLRKAWLRARPAHFAARRGSSSIMRREPEVNRRNDPRFPLCVPAKFFWKDKLGEEHKGDGTTRDVSSSGAFIFTRLSPPPGAAVTVNISLPKISADAVGMRIRALGNVLRVEASVRGQGRSGFAFQSRQMFLGEGREDLGRWIVGFPRREKPHEFE